jgi:hypothetical protein
METGERRKAVRRPEAEDRRKVCMKKFFSSRLRTPVSVLLFLMVFVVPLSAIDINKPVCGISSGILIDIAPFGIEQIYFTTQVLYTFPGTAALSLRPSVSIANSSNMFRIPFVINFSGYVGKKEFFLISGYLGGGLEVYRSTDHNVESPLLTGGITIAAGNFYLDIPVVRAYRSYNTDSDIGITVGLCL